VRHKSGGCESRCSTYCLQLQLQLQQPLWLYQGPWAPYLSRWSSSRLRPYALQVATDASSLCGQRLASARVLIDVLSK
jgi:hypothetical protein